MGLDCADTRRTIWSFYFILSRLFTKIITPKAKKRDSGWGGRGHKFKSCHSYQKSVENR